MASEEYLPLFRQARREHLGNIARVSEEILRLYREAASDLAARAAASRKGSLTQRWAAEYAESLKRRVAELEAELYDVTLQGMKRSAELPSEAMGQWWEAVGGQSFRDAFAATPDDVLAGLLDGSFYRDRKGLSERIWQVAQDFEKDVGYIVQRGIAEKKSVVELAADLEQYVEKPAKRDWDWGKVYPNLSGKKVDYNAQRLARTSINHAYFLDNVKVCTENPFVTAMHWDLSNAHDERQVIPFGPDECDEYAAHEEGLGTGNWKPEEIPVPHPQCLCVQWAVIPQSLEDIGRQIGRWASGEPDALLDEWYEKYGRRNPNGDPKEILREGLQSGEYRGRIKTGNTAVNYPVTEQAIKAVPMINAFESEEKNKQFRAICQDFLRIVKNSEAEPGTEFSAVFNMALQQVGEYRVGEIGKVSIDNPDVFYHALHNHGSDLTLSYPDIAKFAARERQMSISAVGNKGSFYGLFMTIDGDKDGYVGYLNMKSQETIYSVNGFNYTLNNLEQMAKNTSERPVLSDEQQNALETAIIKTTNEILKEGERYGIQYIEAPPMVVNE